jgi:hypothetical protein
LAAAALAPVAAGVGGCVTTSVTPPTAPPDPVVVYLADYGKHSSLLVPRDVTAGAAPAGRDAAGGGEGGRFTEFAYSSWSWSALKRDTWLHVLPTIGIPGQGTLCVKEWPGPLDEGRVRAQSDVEHLYPIRVSRSRLLRLTDRLDSILTGPGERILEAPTGWVYVKDDNPYWVMHTCNQAVVTWLRELGCEVSGPAVYASFDVRAPR